MDRFCESINDDLNMPRAVALTWDLLKSSLPAGIKKGTLLQFDRVLGLKLGEWQPVQEEVPAGIRQPARSTQPGSHRKTLERCRRHSRPDHRGRI